MLGDPILDDVVVRLSKEGPTVESYEEYIRLISSEREIAEKDGKIKSAR